MQGIGYGFSDRLRQYRQFMLGNLCAGLVHYDGGLDASNASDRHAQRHTMV